MLRRFSERDGDISSMSDYIINMSLITFVLNSLIVHYIIPHEILSSTIAPIPKIKRKSLNDSSNYRSITLSSIVGKLMDNAILIKHQDSLKSSDYQFGFKRAHSTTQYTFVIKETVKYYRSHNDVYAMFLDASQAFDRVNFVKLFKLLIKKGLCPLITRFLLGCMLNNA